MTKKVSINTKLYFLAIAITIAIFFTVILSQSHFASSLSINSKSKATPKTPYPGCLPPVSISQDRYPSALYGSNLVYSKMNFTTGISIWAYEPNEFYVWNIGVDHKPNTADRKSTRLNS